MFGIIPLFNADSERNLPTLFNFALLMFSGIMLTRICLRVSGSRIGVILPWAVLAGGFYFMSLDEVFCFHERMNDPVRKILGGNLPSVFHFPFVIPAMVLVALLAVFFWSFLGSLPVHIRRIFQCSAVVYLSGVIGVEMIEGYVYEAMNGKNNLIYAMLANVEEALEMFGLIIFINGLMNYESELSRAVSRDGG